MSDTAQDEAEQARQEMAELRRHDWEWIINRLDTMSAPVSRAQLTRLREDAYARLVATTGRYHQHEQAK